MKPWIGRQYLKTSVLSLAAVTIVVCLISVLSYQFVVHAFDRNHIEDHVNITRQLAEQLDAELDTVVKSASSLMMDQEIIQAIYLKKLEQDNQKVRQIQNKLIAYSKNIKDYYSVDLYVSASNLLISSTNGVLDAASISDETIRLYQHV